MDRKWWLEYAGSIAGDFELWTTSRSAASVWKLNLVNSEPGGGVARRKGWIRQGGNSGFQAVGLAMLFGAARVILLGYDMGSNGDRKHWHHDHPSDLGNPLDRNFAIWRKNFEQMAREATIPIVNASRETALRCFPRKDLDACLAEPAAQRARAA
jgi:hypothetical protein